MAMYSQNIKNLKQKLNLSTPQMAQKLGISTSTLSSYERNVRTPSLDFATLLYEKLNVNLNWFISGEGEMFNTPISNEGFRNSEMINLIDEALKRHGLIK